MCCQKSSDAWSATRSRAAWPAIFEPPMLAAVDLYQLADALAPRTGLMNASQALLAVKPQTVRDHPLAQRLTTQRDPVQLTRAY